MDLLEKIDKRQAIVAIIGLGYVGLPLGMLFARAGFRVVGIDNNPERVSSLQEGHSYIPDVSEEEVRSALSPRENSAGGMGCFRATTDNEVLREADAVIVSVPTPLSKSKEPDLSYVVAATTEVAKRVHRGELVVLESTSYPGTTEELVLPQLSQGGFQAGRDFYLAFSPERIDPGRADWALENTPLCREAAACLYRTAVRQVVPVSSARTAEMVKLLENTFRAVNIGLVNEVAIMCDRLNIDVWEVIEAASSKPFGFLPFYPGPGLGGHCIPVDPLYLAWKLKTMDYHARFIELADQVNFGMPQYVLDKILLALNAEAKAIKGSKVLVLGVAYKRDVADTWESPALDVMLLLQERGAQLSYHDPYVPWVSQDGLELRSIALTTEALEQADCVVIVTDHHSYDWAWIVQHSHLVVDTRNATKGMAPGHARIVKL